jgi:putative (di)nucleoside polyphosphate hydrolase
MIIRKQDQYLVVQRKNDPSHAWKFAQGGVDEGETVVDTALREAQEELGTTKFSVVHVSKYVNQYDWTEQGIDAHYRKTGVLFRGQEQRYIILEFLGKETDINPSPDEIDHYKWISEEEVLEHNTNPDHDYFWNYNGCISTILAEAKQKDLNTE